MINTIYRGRCRVCAPVAALLTGVPAAAAAAPLIDALTESRVALAWPLALLAALLVAVTTAILLQRQARRQQLEAASASERLGTENRKLQQQLQSHRTQLGKFEQQLSESRDSVELLRQQRNDLQAVIVHRLQRPLEAVQGTLNLLLRGGDPETAGLAEMAQRQLEGALQALKQVNPGASANGAGEQPGKDDMRHVSSLSVLLVENEEQDSLQPALEQRGHRVVRTTSGTDGADAALREKFDLVLLDCDLRPLDCVAVTRKIRAEHGRGLPIFVIVTALLGGEKERYQAEGLTGVLSRPVMDAQLQQLLNWTARRRRQPQGAGNPAQARLLNTAVLNRQRDTLGTAVFSELLRGRIASLPKRVTSLTSALTGRHWLDAEQRARAAAASSEEIGLEAIAVRLRTLAESLAVDSEREYCRQQRTEILNLMRSSIQHLKAWRDQNVHASWALK